MTLLNEYVTLADAAEMKGVDRNTIWRWVRTGKLPAEKFGRETAIRLEDLEGMERAPQGRKSQT